MTAARAICAAFAAALLASPAAAAAASLSGPIALVNTRAVVLEGNTVKEPAP